MVCYQYDGSMIEGSVNSVHTPKTIEEIKNIVKTNKIDIIPRGAGTGVRGGVIPDNSIVIDMSHFNQVTELEPLRSTVKVEAGITLKELNEKLESVDFEFPIYYSNDDLSTIGGMVARNTYGARSVKYGPIMNWIEEIEFVNGRGELMKAGSGDIKDICGMEGVTGIIVSVRLRIQKKVERSASVFQSEDLDEIISIARRLKLENEVCRLQLFSKNLSNLLGFPHKYNLIIEFDSDRGKIKDVSYESLINLIDNVEFILFSEGFYFNEDPKLYFDKLQEYITGLEDDNILFYSFLGSGIIFSYYRENQKVLREAMVEVVKKIKSRPGRNGYGKIRKKLVDNFEGRLMNRVKLRHDPFGKLNKGKLIDFDTKRLDAIITRAKVEIDKAPKLNLEKMEKIKPNMGEKVSAEIVEKELEVRQDKRDFEKEKIIEIKKEVDIEKQKKLEEDERLRKKIIQDTLKDYEYTYQSSVSDDDMKVVENYAKNVPKDISKEGYSNLLINKSFNVDIDLTKTKSDEVILPEKSDRILKNEVDKKEVKVDEEKELIDLIIKNNLGESRELSKENIQDIRKRDITRGETGVRYDEFSKEEKQGSNSLINNIMTNKYKSSEENEKDKKKKDDKKPDKDEKDLINKIMTNKFEDK